MKFDHHSRIDLPVRDDACGGRSGELDRIFGSESARVAKLVDARDLKSLDFGHAGSSPAPGTRSKLASEREQNEA